MAKYNAHQYFLHHTNVKVKAMFCGLHELLAEVRHGEIRHPQRQLVHDVFFHHVDLKTTQNVLQTSRFCCIL